VVAVHIRSDQIAAHAEVNGVRVPRGLRQRPVDPRLGVPIPAYVRMNADGSADFTRVDDEIAQRLARAGRCVLCATDLTSTYAFVGGPVQVKNCAFPASSVGHVECFNFAQKTCPFLLKSLSEYGTSSSFPRNHARKVPDQMHLVVVSVDAVNYHPHAGIFTLDTNIDAGQVFTFGVPRR